MEIQKYFVQKKDLSDLIYTFIQSSDSDDENYDKIIQFIKTHEIFNHRDELSHFLGQITRVAENHHRYPGFCSKIERLLTNIKNNIKQSLSNADIFKYFENNKWLLLFSIKEEIITVDDQIADLMKEKSCDFISFFIPELQNFMNSNEFSKQDIEYLNNLEEFEKKRQQGENDFYICSLIRNDSVEEFITYLHQQNISTSSQINMSIFEINTFLTQYSTSLIEYAAFFGSIQIFHYLFNNYDISDLNESLLWLCAIHSNNAELFIIWKKIIFFHMIKLIKNALLKQLNSIIMILLIIYLIILSLKKTISLMITYHLMKEFVMLLSSFIIIFIFQQIASKIMHLLIYINIIT